MLDTFIATRERPMRVLLTDSVGAVVAGVLFLLFGSWGMSVPTVLYYPVIALLCVRRSAPLVFLWGTTVLSGIQYFSAAYYFDVIVYGVTLVGVFGMAAFGARKLRWTCAVPPVLAITVVALQTLTPWMATLPFSFQAASMTDFRDRLQAFVLLTVVIAIAFVAAWALGMLRRQQLVEVVRAQERAELMERDAHRMAELAVSDERSRISREMHDIIAHSLASIVTLAEGGRLAAREKPELATELFGKISDTGRGALGDVKLLLRNVDATQDDAPARGVANIRDLVEAVRVGDAPESGITYREYGTPVELPAGMQLALYRVAQEAVTNMLKHAPGCCGEIELRWGDREVLLRAVNSCTDGADAPSSDRRGIAGMRERVELFDGVLRVTTSDASFEVLASIPIPAIASKGQA
ncbi:sensor histidine kinase [Gulosibacter sediminis]|uniref:sensor histidine kinase n=1 Tax=Gulosibacter sediminis TaxID=1729695 RepID=UPI0024A8EDF2|nr:histidine kinase [Gulosibacter sediminis]